MTRQHREAIHAVDVGSSGPNGAQPDTVMLRVQLFDGRVFIGAIPPETALALSNTLAEAAVKCGATAAVTQ